jgi:hypothetical protein
VFNNSLSVHVLLHKVIQTEGKRLVRRSEEVIDIGVWEDLSV